MLDLGSSSSASMFSSISLHSSSFLSSENKTVTDIQRCTNSSSTLQSTRPLLSSSLRSSSISQHEIEPILDKHKAMDENETSSFPVSICFSSYTPSFTSNSLSSPFSISPEGSALSSSLSQLYTPSNDPRLLRRFPLSQFRDSSSTLSNSVRTTINNIPNNRSPVKLSLNSPVKHSSLPINASLLSSPFAPQLFIRMESYLGPNGETLRSSLATDSYPSQEFSHPFLVSSASPVSSSSSSITFLPISSS